MECRGSSAPYRRTSGSSDDQAHRAAGALAVAYHLHLPPLRPLSQSPPQVSVAPPSIPLGSSLCCILRSARPPRRLSSVCPLLSHTYCDFWHLLSVQVLSEHCYWPGLTRLSALNTPLAPTFLLLCVASARRRVSTSQLCFSRTAARSTSSFCAPRHNTFLLLGLLPVLSNLHLWPSIFLFCRFTSTICSTETTVPTVSLTRHSTLPSWGTWPVARSSRSSIKILLWMTDTQSQKNWDRALMALFGLSPRIQTSCDIC